MKVFAESAIGNRQSAIIIFHPARPHGCAPTRTLRHQRSESARRNAPSAAPLLRARGFAESSLRRSCPSDQCKPNHLATFHRGEDHRAARTRREQSCVGDWRGLRLSDPCLSQIAAQVYSIERIGDLAREAQARIRELGIYNATVKCFDGTLGWAANAPYDAILVAAG